MDELDYNEKQKNALLAAIYAGVISINKLPKKLYTETAKILKNGLYKGYGGTLLDFDFDSPDYKLLSELRNNVYMFSAAKTATQVLEIRDLMFDGDEIIPLKDFKKKALTRFETYNGKEGYLESEWITAQTSGNSAVNWEFAKENEDLFPRLKSVAIIDENTADECRRMNGVVASINDPIWNHNISPRHWRCRCHEERLDKYETEKSTPASKLKEISDENDKTMQDVFKMNPGKDKIVFSEKHPYFQVAKQYPKQAKKNFNLPIPNKD